MINEKIQQAFNEQINHEIGSAYIYLSMASYFHSQNLDGMASWMKEQAKEEMAHAMKLFDHIIDRDGNVVLGAIEKPKTQWSTPLDAWKDAYKHEQFITGRINTLLKLSNAETDFASGPLLNWFVSEQIEEEAQTLKIVQQLEMVGSSGAGLIMLDKQLGKRVEGK